MLKQMYWRMVGICSVLAICVLLAPTVTAQLPPLSPAHLNPMVDKLAAGQPVFGLLTQDISRANARTLSRRDTDFIYVDMEHSPLNLEALGSFVDALSDKAWTAKNGLKTRSAVMARMPPYGSDSPWIVKQALDIGLMGFVFNTVETKEEAEAAVRSMRYPPWRAYPNTHKGPEGFRGYQNTNAPFVWGLSPDEYRRRADLWPLNPEGDLTAFMIIETRKGVQNAEAIAQVPGVTGLSAAAGGDLSSSYGVPADSPEVEAARQTILRACMGHNLACSISPSGKADLEKRIKEGWKMLRTETGARE